MSEIRADTLRTKSSDTNLTMYGEGTGNLVLGSGAGITTISRAGLVDVKNSGTQSAVNLYCESSNAHYVKVRSAAHAAYTGGSWTMTLPGTDGAANQFLQTDGSGNTTWVSGIVDPVWNQISTATADNSTTSLTVSGINTTYDFYHLSLTDMMGATDNHVFRLKVGDSSGLRTDSKYMANIGKHSTTAATHDTAVENNGTSVILMDDAGSAADESGAANMWIHRADQNVNIQGNVTYMKASTNAIRCGHIGIIYHPASAFALTQISVEVNTGNIQTGKMTLWGMGVS